MGAEVKSTIDTSADNIVFQPAPASPKPPSPKPAPTLPPPASQDDSDKEPHLGASNFNIFAFVFQTVMVSHSRVFKSGLFADKITSTVSCMENNAAELHFKGHRLFQRYLTAKDR